MNRRIAPFLLAACLIPFTTAHAVVKAPIPVSGSYASAKQVIVARVTRFNPESGALEAAATTLRGEGLGDVIRLRVENLPEITSKLKEGSPLVLFVARTSKNYALHLADTWVLPVPVADKPGLFHVTQTREAAMRQSYPGTTGALVKLVEELKAGKSPMLNEVSPEMFKGGTKDLGKVPGGPFTSFVGFKNAGKSCLAAKGTGAVSIFEATPTALRPVQPSIQPPAPRLTPDKAGTDPRQFLTWAEGDFGEDPASPAIIAIKQDSILRLPDGGDFVRMTGEHLSTYFRDNPRPLAGAQICTLDCNGDGRTDLLIAAPTRSMLLINRGFGAFFVNPDITTLLVDSSGKSLITDKSAVAGLDIDGDGLDDLVIINQSGTATAVTNPKPKS